MARAPARSAVSAVPKGKTHFYKNELSDEMFLWPLITAIISSIRISFAEKKGPDDVLDLLEYIYAEGP